MAAAVGSPDGKGLGGPGESGSSPGAGRAGGTMTSIHFVVHPLPGTEDQLNDRYGAAAGEGRLPPSLFLPPTAAPGAPTAPCRPRERCEPNLGAPGRGGGGRLRCGRGCGVDGLVRTPLPPPPNPVFPASPARSLVEPGGRPGPGPRRNPY